MATTVTKSIGTTGRDYSTLQAWEDACPANLVTADQIWRGECYNDSEFTAGVTISGQTTDATRYVELTAAAGQSFQDHADVRTNPLRYDQTKGVGVTASVGYYVGLVYSSAIAKISRLQIKNTATNGVAVIFEVGNCTLRECFCQSQRDANAVVTSASGGYDNGRVFNCVLVQLGAGNGIWLYNSSIAVGNTIIKPSDIEASGVGINAQYGSSVASSNAVFGFSTAADGTSYGTCQNNGTNLASGLPGTGNVYNVTYNQTTPFVDADKDSLDLRAIAATDLIDAGYRDATNAPNDISGTARYATPTIGAWEYVAGGQTFEDSFTVASNAGVSSLGRGVFGRSIALPGGGGVSGTRNLVIGKGFTVPVTADISSTGAKLSENAVAYSAVVAVGKAAQVESNPALTLPVTGGITTARDLSLATSLSLPATGDFAIAHNVTLPGSFGLSCVLAFTASLGGGITYEVLLELAAALAAAVTRVLVIPAAASFAVNAGVSAARQAELYPTFALPGYLQVSPAGQSVAGNSVSLAAVLELATAGQLDAQASVDLAARVASYVVFSADGTIWELETVEHMEWRELIRPWRE